MIRRGDETNRNIANFIISRKANLRRADFGWPPRPSLLKPARQQSLRCAIATRFVCATCTLRTKFSVSRTFQTESMQSIGAHWLVTKSASLAIWLLVISSTCRNHRMIMFQFIGAVTQKKNRANKEVLEIIFCAKRLRLNPLVSRSWVKTMRYWSFEEEKKAYSRTLRRPQQKGIAMIAQ